MCGLGGCAGEPPPTPPPIEPGVRRIASGEHPSPPPPGRSLPVLQRGLALRAHGGARRALVVGVSSAVLLDPESGDVQAFDLPASLAGEIAYDPLGERWALAQPRELVIVDEDANVTRIALPEAPSGGWPMRGVARIGDEWWSFGQTLERVRDDGSVVPTGMATARFGCVGARPGGAWLALPTTTGGLEVLALDPLGEPLASPRHHWSVSTPESGCSFRMLGADPYLCAQHSGWTSGPYETCADALDESPDAPRFHVATGAAGSWDGEGYVLAGSELERFVPSLAGTDLVHAAPDGHVPQAVVAVDGALWALTLRDGVYFVGELGPDLEVREPRPFAAGRADVVTEHVRWLADARWGLLGAWMSERRTGELRLGARCGLLRVSLEDGALTSRESDELCDTTLVAVDGEVLMVTPRGIRPLLEGLAPGAVTADTPTLPLLGSGHRALFGTFGCRELVGCSLSTAVFDGEATMEAETSPICPTTPRVLGTASASWGFVVAFRCEDEVRAVVLDTGGAERALSVLGTARWGGFGPILHEDVELHVVGDRALVTVQASLGLLHLFPFLDAAAEEPLIVHGPTTIWPGSDVLFLPEGRFVVDLETRETTRALWLAELDALDALEGERLPAGDGTVWIVRDRAPWELERWELVPPPP